MFQNQNWISVFTNKSGIPIKCTDKKFTDYTIPEMNKINVKSAKITFKKTKVYYRNQYIYDKRKAFNYKKNVSQMVKKCVFLGGDSWAGEGSKVARFGSLWFRLMRS